MWYLEVDSFVLKYIIVRLHCVCIRPQEVHKGGGLDTEGNGRRNELR